jgi:uncharacterized membrane protein YqaE (UPF0057 family)
MPRDFDCSLWDCCLILIVILCPPVAVFFEYGCDTQFWLNLVLWLLGIIPGIVHAIWAIWWREPTRVYVV